MSFASLVRLVAAVLTTTLLAAACGGSDSAGSADTASAGELLDFALVQENEFTFESDPADPNRGIFHVRTTEPMICAIVWGETEAFGNFNNSLAMNGTGIIDHDVVLPGAEAGKTYFFRVQGSTASGNQYRSELSTFTLPELDGDAMADDTIEHGDNFAIEATIVEASSIFGPGWEAENAIDDDTNTEWASSGDGDEGFITIDLGAEHEVVGVEFLTRRMLDGTATTEMYTITVDGGETFGPFPAGNPADPNFTAADFTGREIRFDVDSSTGGNVGAIEVRVFAPAS